MSKVYITYTMLNGKTKVLDVITDNHTQNYRIRREYCRILSLEEAKCSSINLEWLNKRELYDE